MIGESLVVILPEILLALYAVTTLLAAAYTRQDRFGSALLWATAVVFVIMAFGIGTIGEGTRTGFGGMIVDDSFARFAKVAILLSAAAVLVMSESFMRSYNLLRFEYPMLVTLAVVGMMIMVSAGDLMVLYLGLELQTLALYVVASLRRGSVRSTEAGLKFFVLGALSSAILLYGASLIYGFSGATLFADIATATQPGQTSLGLLIGIAFLIAGMSFTVSAVPFHMWTPDVYEGMPTPITAFFATAPKVAAMALFARLLHDAFGNAVRDWQEIMAFLSGASMFLGAIAAIGQRNIKRLMAFSSIAHMGFALMGLAAGTLLGVQAMLVYIAIYLTMTIGTYAFILMMQKDETPLTDIDALQSYAQQSPGRALAMMVLLFSLAGLPPMLGFFGKLYVLRAAYEGGLAWLAVAGVIASVIGAFYYIRIVFYMYFGEESSEQFDDDTGPVLPVFLTCAAAIVVFGIVNMFGVETAAMAAAEALVK
ncbi:MAG: NADH-quinone oxidoreductase subunit NuoN [Pseudomonadota bacterium]